VGLDGGVQHSVGETAESVGLLLAQAPPGSVEAAGSAARIVAVCEDADSLFN
jgi:hypothetical protein